MPKGTIFLRKDFNPVGCEIFVVQEDEKRVEQRDERCYDAEQDAGRLAHQRENLGHSGVEGVAEVLAMQKFGDLFLVTFNPVRDIFCEVVGVGCLVQPLRENVLHLVGLLNHGRNDEIEHAADDNHDHKEGHDDAQRPYAQMELVFDEFHNRIEQIGQQPCDEEWQQHAAQIVE